MCGATYLLYPPAARLLPWLAHETAALYAMFRAPELGVLLLVPIVIGEELVWRGLVQGALTERIGAARAVALAAAAFALAHAPLGSPLLPIVAFACALAWGTLRALTGSLVPAIVAHLVWNGGVLVLAPLA
jgi:membrane protease YdiL (CAAX protease family)